MKTRVMPNFAEQRKQKVAFKFTQPKMDVVQGSILNSVQKVDQASNYNSMKSLNVDSPKNIHDKINFINQLYDQLNEPKHVFTSNNKKQQRNHSPINSANRSTDTPEQMQPVQPMQLDANETIQYSKLWTFHHNSREPSHDHTTEVRAFDQTRLDTDNSIMAMDISESTKSKTFLRTSQAMKSLKQPSKLSKVQEREQMINEMFEDLQGRTSKSSKRKNFVEMNKKTENLGKKPHQAYEKMLETIDRRLKQASKTPTKPKRQFQMLPKPLNMFQQENSRQSSQASQSTLQNQSRSNLQSQQNRSTIKQDYKKFLEEINNLGEKLCKTSGSLNRTMNEIRERSKNKY